MRYRAEIDGLRALAVIPVVLFHAGFELFSGGFAGVDVFFVISGFLITTILIEDIESKRFSIVNFYERRARRILPALIFVLLMFALLSWLVLLPHEMRTVYQQIVSNSLFLSNIHYTLIWGYFEQWKLPPLLLNSWSLAVEEQFYVIIPLILIIFKTKPRASVIVISSLALVSALLMIWLNGFSKQANYYLLVSRFWELAAGSLLAYFLKFRPDYVKRLGEHIPTWGHDAIGLSLIIIFFTFTDKIAYPSAWTMLVVLLTGLAITLVNNDTLFGKFLSHKYTVYVGKISYPLYLFHFPIIILLRMLMEPVFKTWQIALPAVILTILASVFTFHFIEFSFRTKTILKTKARMLSASIFSLGFIAALGLLGHFNVLKAYSLTTFPELSHLTEKFPLPPGVSISDCAAQNSSTECDLIKDGSDQTEKRNFLIVGDSFAADLVSPIWRLLKNEQSVNLSARITYACSYMPSQFSNWGGECGEAREQVERLDATQVTDVIFHINFIGHLEHKNEEFELQSLTNMFIALRENDINIHVVGAREVFSVEPARAKLYPWLSSALKAKKESRTLSDFYSKWSDMGIHVYKRASDLDAAKAYRYYRDSGHFSYSGSKNFMSRLGIISPSDFLVNE